MVSESVSETKSSFSVIQNETWLSYLDAAIDIVLRIKL